MPSLSDVVGNNMALINATLFILNGRKTIQLIIKRLTVFSQSDKAS